MARSLRFTPPGCPVHVTQRGSNRMAVFACDDDRHTYLYELEKLSVRTGCQVHAYCLMTTHIHVVGTPAADDSLSRLMQQLDGGYARYFNKRQGRSGPLWQGRFFSSVIDSERYFLEAMTYVERNPEKALMVEAAAQYRWSSHRRNAYGFPDKLVTPHEIYRDLGRGPVEAMAAYRQLFAKEPDPDVLAAIRDATKAGTRVSIAHELITRRTNGTPPSVSDTGV